MEVKMIISMGDCYGDKKFTFNDDKDALLFFQLLSRATELNRDYVTGGIGDVFEVQKNQRNSSFIKYSGVYTVDELKIVKEEENIRLEIEREKAEMDEEQEKVRLQLEKDKIEADELFTKSIEEARDAINSI